MKCHFNFYVRSINFLRWAQTTSHQHRYVWQDKTFHICLRTQIHLPRQHITNNRSGMAETIILQLAVFRRVSHHFVYIMLDYTGNIVVHITKHTHTHMHTMRPQMVHANKKHFKSLRAFWKMYVYDEKYTLHNARREHTKETGAENSTDCTSLRVLVFTVEKMQCQPRNRYHRAIYILPRCHAPAAIR